MKIDYNLTEAIIDTYERINLRINKPTLGIRKGVTLCYTVAIISIPTIIPLWTRMFHRKSI